MSVKPTRAFFFFLNVGIHLLVAAHGLSLAALGGGGSLAGVHRRLTAVASLVDGAQALGLLLCCSGIIAPRHM